MGHNNPLTAKVNFYISVIFLGSAALLAIVVIINVSGNDNPIANLMVQQNLDAQVF